MNAALMNLWARWRPLLGFSGSQDYWRQRYRRGGDSGTGSGGDAARYKATVLNNFVRQHDIRSVVEFGCGDGRQLLLADYPSYAGYDISPEAVLLCRELFATDTTKQFKLVEEYAGITADLSISLDVIFHLVEDEVYEDYLRRLFAAGSRFVAIYSSDMESAMRTLPHVRHRSVSKDIAEKIPGFERIDFPESGTTATVDAAMRFLFYRREYLD